MDRLYERHWKVWLQNNVKCEKYHRVKFCLLSYYAKKMDSTVEKFANFTGIHFLHFTTFCNETWQFCKLYNTP